LVLALVRLRAPKAIGLFSSTDLTTPARLELRHHRLGVPRRGLVSDDCQLQAGCSPPHLCLAKERQQQAVENNRYRIPAGQLCPFNAEAHLSGGLQQSRRAPLASTRHRLARRNHEFQQSLTSRKQGCQPDIDIDPVACIDLPRVAWTS
uniref:Integron gene cassette protein n=1 Tax=Macrostomum lignano TaxID=282301 RepID=A0A1I8FFH8_9PLAT